MFCMIFPVQKQNLQIVDQISQFKILEAKIFN